MHPHSYSRTVFPLVVSALLEAEDLLTSPRTARRPQLSRRRRPARGGTPWSDDGGEAAWPPSPPLSTPPGFGAAGDWVGDEGKTGEGESLADTDGPLGTVPTDSPPRSDVATSSNLFGTPSSFGAVRTSPRRAPGTGLPFPSPHTAVALDRRKGGGEVRARSAGSVSTLDEVVTPFSHSSDGDAAAGSHAVGV